MATAAVLLAVAAPAQAAPFAYVGLGQNDEVAQYDVGSGGLLAPLSPFTVAAFGKLTDNVAIGPDGKSVYVGNSGLLADDPEDEPGSISQYDVGTDGTLSPKSPAKVTSCGSTGHQVAISPDDKSAYVATGADCSAVFQYDVAADGRLSPKSPAFVDVENDNGQPVGVAVSPDSQSVYVANASGPADGVYQYDVGAGGVLIPKSPPAVAAGGFSLGVAVTPDGQSVYVTNSPHGSQGTVSQYDVGADGKLSPKSPATVAAGIEPWSLVVSPDGKSAYVADRTNDNVLQYDIEQASGTLSPKTPPTVATGDGAVGIAVTPDGRSVYVTNHFDDNVSQYDVGVGGELALKSPPTVAAGGLPTGIAVSPVAQPTTKKQCRHGGWREFGFKSKRKCIRFVKRQARRACRAEREEIGRPAFRKKYGKGKHHRHALRNCIKQSIGAR